MLDSALLRRFAQEHNGAMDKNTASALVDGIRIELKRKELLFSPPTFPGAAGAIAFYDLTAPVRAAFSFKVSRDRGGWLASLLAAPVVPTGDADFDRQYCLRSESGPLAAATFSAESVRKAAADLLGMGWRHVTCDGMRLTTELRPNIMANAALMSKSAVLLAALAKALPDGAAAP